MAASLKVGVLTLKNFLSTGRNGVTIDLSSHKTTMVTGKNGCGKSTIVDAIHYSIYNKTYRTDINLGDLVNRNNDKEMVVDLTLHRGDKKLRIVRGQKPSVFELYYNDKYIEPTSEKSYYQDIINKFVGMTSKVFGQVSLLGSVSYKPFMQLSAPDRRGVLEDIFNLNIIGHLLKSVKDDNRELKKEVLQLNSKIDQVNTEISGYNALIKRVMELKAQSQTNLDDDIAQLKETVEKLTLELDQSQKEADDINEKIKGIASPVEIISKLQEMKTKLGVRIESLDKECRFYSKHDSCPTCNTAIDADKKNQIIQTNTGEITKLREGQTKAAKALVTHNTTLVEIQNLTVEMNESLTNVRLINNRIKQSNASIQNLLEKKSKQADDNQYDTTETEASLEEANKHLESLLETKATNTNTQDVLDTAMDTLGDNGVKKLVFKKYLSFLNQTINKYIKALGFNIRIVLNEDFGIKVVSRNKDKFKYGSFSEGQKKRLDLAIMLAFRELAAIKNSALCSFLLLDEIFDSSMDSDGVYALINCFKLMDDTNVLVIGHNTNISSQFDRHIEVTKKQDFTVYTEK